MFHGINEKTSHSSTGSPTVVVLLAGTSWTKARAVIDFVLALVDAARSREFSPRQSTRSDRERCVFPRERAWACVFFSCRSFFPFIRSPRGRDVALALVSSFTVRA